MARREERERNDDERHTPPHLVVAAWARSQLGVGVGGATSW
jgi:hypothetical protein